MMNEEKTKKELREEELNAVTGGLCITCGTTGDGYYVPPNPDDDEGNEGYYVPPNPDDDEDPILP